MGKIVCNVCEKKCKGDVLKVDNKYIHKQCFVCIECKNSLEKGGFYLKNGKYYCPSDYQNVFGIKCGICSRIVEGEVVTLLKVNFHKECFHCKSCEKPFQAKERVTLWDKDYLCKQCSTIRQVQQDNPSKGLIMRQSMLAERDQESSSMSPSSTLPPGFINGDCSAIASSTPIASLNGINGHGSDTGYTSTDSCIDKSKSEADYCSHPSPCYSLSSGDDSSVNRTVSRSRRSSGPGDGRGNNRALVFGKFYNISYLRLEEEKQGQGISPRDMFSRTLLVDQMKNQHQMNTTTGSGFGKPNHFHRPQTSFSYRASPNHSLDRLKGGMSVLAEKSVSGQPQSTHRRVRSVSPARGVEDREPKRLAALPSGQESKENQLPPIERFDWPGPPSPAVIMIEKRRSYISTHTNGTTDTVDGSTCSPSRSRVSLESSTKFDSEITELNKMADKSGISKALMKNLEEARKHRSHSPDLDPVSASRAPNAAAEPPFKTRYDRHIFASPSRDNQHDRRDYHNISYRMDYSKTGGRTSGTLPASLSMAKAGYTQGLLMQPSRSVSLPRPAMDYINDSSSIHSPMTRSAISALSTTDGGMITDESMLQVTGGSNSTLTMNTSVGGRRGNRTDMDIASVRSVQSWLKPWNNKSPPKIYSYDEVKVSNTNVPKDVDHNKLEAHLNETEFEKLFEMTRSEFYRMPVWKQNDMKRRLELF